jgi:hypothetical protein
VNGSQFFSFKFLAPGFMNLDFWFFLVFGSNYWDSWRSFNCSQPYDSAAIWDGLRSESAAPATIRPVAVYFLRI